MFKTNVAPHATRGWMDGISVHLTSRVRYRAPHSARKIFLMWNLHDGCSELKVSLVHLCAFSNVDLQVVPATDQLVLSPRD